MQIPPSRGLVVSLVLVASLAAPGHAQDAQPRYRMQHYHLDSARHDGTGDAARIAFSGDVHVDDAVTLQFLFAAYDLGEHSWLELRSAWDGGWQRLNARSLADWNSASAVFNGNRVAVELHVAPGDRGVFVRVEALKVEEEPDLVFLPETLCGNDDRVASTDNRVGRLRSPGCTAWRVTNGALLTAGHCADLDPDASGPLLPDGVLDLAGVVEFNVPASQPNGTLVAADPNDQYPIDVGAVAWRHDGTGQGLGKDWAVFRVKANSNTGLLPHEAYGLPFRMTREAPPNNATLRVTGFGTDSTPAGTPGGPGNAQNQTNQTSTGTMQGEVQGNVAADISVTYAVDTTGANSGSPIIWEQYDLTVGVHTNGGCAAMGGTNSGTSFEVDGLETTLQNVPGPDAVYVDAQHPRRDTQAAEGTIFRPFDTLAKGIAAVPTGGIVSVVEGAYTLPSGTLLEREMTIEAPAGTVLVSGN